MLNHFVNVILSQVIRENVMVAIANIAGHTELAGQPESLVRPILSGLLEWSVSPAAAAQDSFPNVGPHSPISPQRLAIESLCKLCVQVNLLKLKREETNMNPDLRSYTRTWKFFYEEATKSCSPFKGFLNRFEIPKISVPHSDCNWWRLIISENSISPSDNLLIIQRVLMING